MDNNENGDIDSNQTPTNSTDATTEPKKPTYRPVKTKSFVIRPPQLRDDSEYLGMTQDELINEVKRLRAYCVQLKNLLARAVGENSAPYKVDLIKEAKQTAGIEVSCSDSDKQVVRATKKQLLKGKKDRPFDASKFNKRHVLLKFAYLGWDYHVSNTYNFLFSKEIIKKGGNKLK